ncbi:hypothetical protein Pmani_015861 [Petrolisthes manimaculis]|uniref:Angiogenic factor with G patch and FHA domains 1 n=1 Tax=Petrolisthes manimaculis TaxID=1843537 RepID=A0AAE1PRC6_9EUCA|nr:hypothetical protein Pmani_015861 [Petrolisthes manimaculis]
MLLPGRVFRDFSMEDVLGDEVMAAMMTQGDVVKLECGESGECKESGRDGSGECKESGESGGSGEYSDNEKSGECSDNEKSGEHSESEMSGEYSDNEKSGECSEKEKSDESVKSNSEWRVMILSRLKLHIIAVTKLQAVVVDLVSHGRTLELSLEDFQNLKIEEKVDVKLQQHDVCCQTTENDINNATRKWNDCYGQCITTDFDTGLKNRAHEMCSGNSTLAAEGSEEIPRAKRQSNEKTVEDESPACVSVTNRGQPNTASGEQAQQSTDTSSSSESASGELQECTDGGDKSVLKKEINPVKIDSSDVSDGSGRGMSGSDETKDSSGDLDSERTEKKKKHKHKSRDKSKHKGDRHRKRSSSKKTKVKKKSSKDRDKEQKDDVDENSERRKTKKKSKHKKNKTSKDDKDKTSDKKKRKAGDGDGDGEVTIGGEEDKAYDWNRYYGDWTKTWPDYNNSVTAWDQSEYSGGGGGGGGGDGEKDLVGGWDLSGTESIAQQVEKAATAALQGNSFVYDEQLGLYYDYSSGYYYNSEHGLYYDGKTGTYFFYDHDSKTYKFHSQVTVPSKDETKHTKTVADNKKSVQDSEGTDVKEEGECSDSENEKTEAVEDDTNVHDEENKNDQDSDRETYVASPHYGMGDLGEGTGSSHVPPSLRLMVVGGGSETVKVGTLHLVTLSGGTVGREKTNLVELPDITISKIHAEFSYSSEASDDHHYFVKDLGSSNGTVVNGTRLSQPHQPSEPVEVGHGWVVEFGTVQVVCHIHPGYLTCNECEPGIVLSRLPSGQSSGTFIEPSQKISVSKEKSRKKQLKAIRKKYALSSRDGKFMTEEAYVDRAQKRRTEIGSDNPFEKTEVASTEFALRENNKGFGLLQKMGWSEGTALGKSQTGITEPIQAVSTMGRAGLGSSQHNTPAAPPTIKKRKRLNITKQRFVQASKDT